MLPGQDFHPPAAPVHPLQGAVEPPAFTVTGAGAGQQRYDAGVVAVVKGILKHPQLQPAVGYFLLAAVAGAPVEQLNLYALVLQAVPQLAHFRRDGAGGNRCLQGAVGVCQPQQVVKVDANQIARAGGTVPFLGKPLRFVVNVGIVPIDEHAAHRGSSRRGLTRICYAVAAFPPLPLPSGSPAPLSR